MTETIAQMGELGLIRRIRAGGGATVESGVRAGIGDDAAVLEVTPGSVLLATTDLLVEDVHFRRASASMRDVGWKAMAVNLSDIAAMGGIPRWALVALALPPSVVVDDVDAFYGGMREAAAPHGVSIVGGDTSVSPGGWMINVTVLGEHAGTPRLRSMARPGDAVVVTGTLGRSAAGLAAIEMESESARLVAMEPAALEDLRRAHRRPTARIREGHWLGAQPAVHALMDCSDGLATDLGHICRESAVAARVYLERLPVAPAVREAARALGRDPIAWATGGGEDYELLLTCAPDTVKALAEGLLSATGTPLVPIGEIASGEPGVTWLDARGEVVPVRAGYEHFRG